MFLKTSTSEEAKEPPPPSAETLGAYLKSARLSQGLDLDAIADETRIISKCLAALEENNRADLPPDVFSRGFVKIYAAQLKLDPLEALRLYEKQWGAEGPCPENLRSSVTPARLVRPGIAVSLLIIALFFAVRVYYPGDGSPLGQQDDLPSKPSATNTPPTDAPTSTSEQPAPRDLTASPAASAEKTAVEPAPETVGQAEPPPADTATPSPTGPAALPPYEIRLLASRQTAIKLSLDGGEPVETMLPPGDSQTWQASTGFDLTLNSADEAKLTINGAEVPINTEAGPTVTIHRP